MAFDMKDYVEVADRIRAWYAEYPDGRIETEIVEFSDKRATVKALAFRGQTDSPAGVGHSYLAVPGSTPYTKGSELENAETSAVGRALVMAGIPAKNVASSSEVASKRAGASTANANVGAAGDAKSTKASRDEATPASLPASSSHLAGVGGAGTQSAERLGKDAKADEGAGVGKLEGNPAPAPSQYLTREEQKVFARAFGGQVAAVKAARERFGDRIRGLDDLTREMATELVAAKVGG